MCGARNSAHSVREMTTAGLLGRQFGSIKRGDRCAGRRLWPGLAIGRRDGFANGDRP